MSKKKNKDALNSDPKHQFGVVMKDKEEYKFLNKIQ